MDQEPKDAKDELLPTLLGYFETSLSHPSWTEFYKNAQSDFEYYEGQQWTSDEIKELNDRGQPVIVENEIAPIIDRIEGQYVSQKTRLGFLGRTPQDEEVTTALTDIALYVQQSADYEYEEKDSFNDGTKCGFGVIESGIDESGYFPQIILKHEDCLNIYPDPFSKRYDWSDAQFIHRAKWVGVVEAKNRYPGHKSMIEGGVQSDQITNSIPSFKKENYHDGKNQRIRLIETWYKTSEKRTFSSVEGKFEDVTDKPGKAKGLQTIEKTLSKMKMAVWCQSGVLESGDSPYEHKMFPFIPFFVKRKKSGEPMGVIRALKDPQSEINKRRSKALHLLSMNQFVYEEGAVRDEDNLRAEMARPDGLISYKKGYQAEINKNIDMADTQMSLLNESKGAIKRIAGMDLGFSQEVRSNEQLQRKQKMEDTVIVPIFDNLRRTRKIVAKHIYGLVKQYFGEEMVFNITDNQQAARQVAVSKDIMARIKESEFDIIVEEMPETSNIQAEQFTMVSQMLQSMNLLPNRSMALLPTMIQMSQLRNKADILKQFSAMEAPPPDHPKISMNIDYINLSPGERMAFAEMMQSPTLMQAIQQMAPEPPYMVKEQAGITKQQIKTQGDIDKANAGKEDPQIAIMQKAAEMEMKGQEHSQKMSMKQDEHAMKMQQSHEKGAHDMQMAQMKGKQSLIQGAMTTAQQLEASRLQAKNKPNKPSGGKN